MKITKRPLENAEVISGHAYRTYKQAYHAVQAQYAGTQVLSAQTYQSTIFTGPDNQELSKPALALNTNSVVVRDPKSVYGTMNLVLLESVLDLTTLEVLPKSVTSVLLSAGGWVITTVIYRYLECGDLHFGFARVKCQDCGHEYLPASQKRRKTWLFSFLKSARMWQPVEILDRLRFKPRDLPSFRREGMSKFRQAYLSHIYIIISITFNPLFPTETAPSRGLSIIFPDKTRLH
jgi:hypothetical protein